MNSKSNLLSILTLCGACISFYIGAGFATMQEVVQYEASYGSLFPIVIFVVAVIYVYTNLSFATNGNRLNLSRGGDIFGTYCGVFGKKFGKIASVFFDYFSAIFCYMSFVVMCGGASSTMTQQWGLPVGIGAVILTIAVICTVVFGLDGILNALSKIGPVIIIMILLVSIVTAISGAPNYAQNLAAVDAGTYSDVMQQVGNGNPFASGASYGGFVILWFAAFLAEIGAKNKLKNVNLGMLLSTIFIFGAASICCLALIGHIDTTAAADIPALVLAGQVSPVLAQLFAIIICAGIYTSAVPLLWTGIRKISKEGTSKYKIITIIGGILGCIIACFVPYKGLINVLYGLNGYLGFILVFFMIIYDIKTKMSKKAN
ncbi:Uncharacterized membrane protein [Coprococcus catus GD/7]|uniref:Uncharacterized membrane protein n=1 Tax=Coprococcus catus GD/7 TaxID=717962 RepID=D4J4W2_9FIRM|nr:hypothetical protein [Coprococcus catus]CBK79383.1 Uncharacterized membrane protein [Coprococcus catus GD/7]